MPYIDSYVFGMATIDGHVYSSDMKIFPDHVKPSWWREEGHVLSIRDIEDAIASSPDVIIIGSGSSGMMKVPREVRRKIESSGIELIVLPTKEAVSEHNRFSGLKKVITCLHLTC